MNAEQRISVLRSSIEKNIVVEKKKFLLRIDDKVYNALEKWAADDLRSINSQIEFLLKDILKKNGRLPDQTANASEEKKEEEPG